MSGFLNDDEAESALDIAAGSAPETGGRQIVRRLRRRRERLFGRILAYFAIIVVIFVSIAARKEIPSDLLRDEMLRLIRGVYDREVSIDRATINLIGGVTLYGLRVHNPPGYASPYFLEAPKVLVTVSLLPKGPERIVPRRLRLPGAVVRIERPRGALWNIDGLTKPPLDPRKEYTATIEIEDGRFEYFDGEIGDSGFTGVLGHFDGTYLIKSTAENLSTIFSVKDQVLDDPAGARVDLAIQTWPLTKRTELHAFFRGFDLPHFRPFYRWLPDFTVEAGRGNFTGDAVFEREIPRWTGRIDLEGIRAVHAPSGRRWEDGALTVGFECVLHDTWMEIVRAEAEGANTLMVMTGHASNRTAAVADDSIAIEVPRTRLEEIDFFAADSRLATSGPAVGVYRFIRAGADAGWDVRIEAGAADVSYGSWFRKRAGAPGSLHAFGVPGRGLERMNVRFGGSEVRLGIRPGALDVDGSGVRLADVRAFVPAVPIDRWPGVDVGGRMDVDAVIRPAPRGAVAVEGSIDLTRAAVAFGNVVRKPEGVPMTAGLHLVSAGESITFDPLDLQISRSTFVVRGDRSPTEADLRIHTPRALFEDARAFIPAIPLQSIEPFRGRGPFSGDFTYRARRADEFEFAGRADLTRSALRVGDILEKPIGDPAAVEVSGRSRGEALEFETGVVTIGGSRLAFRGTTGPEGGQYQIYGTSINLAELKAHLTQPWVRDYGLLGVSGPAITRALLRTQGDRWDVVGLLDLTPAYVTYGETFDKPAGVAMAADYEIQSVPSRMDVRHLDIRLGHSILNVTGRIDRGETTAFGLHAKADLDAAEIRHLVPGLSRIRIMGSPASRVLRTMSDPQGRFDLEFDVLGPASNPDIVVASRAAFFEALNNAIGAHVRIFPNILGMDDLPSPSRPPAPSDHRPAQGP